MTRRDSEPQIPPAKAHTVPLPIKQRPVTAEAEQKAAPPAPAPVETEQTQTSHKPLDAVDREIADEADRLLQGGVSAESSTEGVSVPPEQSEVTTDTSVPAPANEVASTAGVHLEAVPDEEVAPDKSPSSDLQSPQPEENLPTQSAFAPEQPWEAPSQVSAAVAQPVPPSEPQSRPDSEPAAAPLAASSEPKAQVIDKTQRSSWVARVALLAVAAVIGVLVVINYPLRLLPEPARTIFNWFAASLLLWVPAIWFIALYVI